jgi:ribosomal protein S18 acetylase RimI-like enzyme
MPDQRRPIYRIEPMSMDDFNDVLRLWKKTDGVGITESDSRSATRQYLARNPGLSLVARDGRRIVGTVLCGHDGRRGYLYHLAVAKAHRRNGLGRKLVDLCLAKLEKLGIPRCNAYVFADNRDGEAFWLRNGWEKRSHIQLLQKVITRRKNECGC